MNIVDIFASQVFDEHVMRERLPHDTYKKLRKSMEERRTLDRSIADVVANAMKDWAIEKGATHYTHWFQPLNGVTAEKHDSFICPTGDGQMIMEFSGKELIKGESDASSFPSGGLRATFEARGYTAWDPTSYAFIKDGTLCIPTAFCSYGGEALDKKTPLLRSMEALEKQVKRILALFGKHPAKVSITVGAEQEYFLVDREVYQKRQDLVITGRTLFGAKPSKGQELEDHYFGVIKPRVSAFMKELDEELWKLGIPSKTKHNEAAPGQHELAPVFTSLNLASDQNQLTMEIMKRVAERHGLVCLLHEKPFQWVNGSGKHNNWSMSTSDGENLLDPGKTPYDNAQFLLFLGAVIRAVNEHQDLLRLSVASAGNDHRLGGDEAPPAIISMFLGEELTEIMEAIANATGYDEHEKEKMELGVAVLPHFSKDSTDRNRTSPFAFTGNKFEFRMPGSSLSIAGPNIVLNTTVADVLRDFADRLEQAEDFPTALALLIRDNYKENRRIVFNGNNYSEEWEQEAARRGLFNLATTADAIPCFETPENIALFTRHGVFTESEVHSRTEIHLDSYCKVINIEALTMLEMAKKNILPAVISFGREVAEAACAKDRLGVPIDTERALLNELSAKLGALNEGIDRLDNVMKNAKNFTDSREESAYYRDSVCTAMKALRETADQLEEITAKQYWPYPSYGDLLFSVM